MFEYLTLGAELAKAEARVKVLEAFAKRVADSDMTGGAPAYVVEARKLLYSAPEREGIQVSDSLWKQEFEDIASKARATLETQREAK